ncbi:heat shock protein-like protein 30 [Bisporella sp. PMI_857]|nr:heat shock protein-like protein 30 [Bisporella sp. PMI_857]
MMTSPNSSHEFSPIFRLIDQIDRHFSHSHRFVHTYTPRFDLEELKDSYVLYGELPGALQKDLTIIATDNHTLEISGKTERYPEEGVTPKKQEHQNKDGASAGEDAAARSVEIHPESGNLGIAKMSGSQPKCMLSERLVGDFHRSFSFPKPIEPSGVAANMQNGVIRVVVPKGPAPKERNVPVSWSDIAYAGF